MFEDFKHERLIILLLSITDPNIPKQSKFTDHVIKIIKKPSSREITQTKNIETTHCGTIIRMAYPNWENEDLTLLKITTKDDELKELKDKAEKHDYENILESLKIDNDYYKKKYKSLKKKEINFNYF